MGTTYILNTDQMGGGDRALGLEILASCLRKLVNRTDTDAIVFYNAGVKLLTESSPVATEISLLKRHGVELLPCGTCVGHFGLRDRLLTERVSNMDEILATIAAADKAVTL